MQWADKIGNGALSHVGKYYWLSADVVVVDDRLLYKQEFNCF